MPALPTLVFDVNETLLDLESLEPHFERLFGDRTVLREWFAQVILYSEALSLAGGYAPFGELGGAVLKMVAATRGLAVSEADLQSVKEGVASMPAHPEVPSALARLRAAGFRTFTLTNNPKATCSQQLEHAGLAHLFDGQFSVDDGVRRYKPAPEVYHAVATALGVPPSQLFLIACHAWDTLGAASAGWESALILRRGNAPFGVGPQPQMTGTDLHAVADFLIGRFAGQGG